MSHSSVANVINGAVAFTTDAVAFATGVFVTYQQINAGSGDIVDHTENIAFAILRPVAFGVALSIAYCVGVFISVVIIEIAERLAG